MPAAVAFALELVARREGVPAARAEVGARFDGVRAAADAVGNARDRRETDAGGAVLEHSLGDDAVVLTR